MFIVGSLHFSIYFRGVQGDGFRYLVLAEQSQTQRQSVYSDIKHKKTANLHIGEAGTAECVVLLNKSIIKIIADSFSL